MRGVLFGSGENAIGGSAFESTFSATEIWVRIAVIIKNTTLKVAFSERRNRVRIQIGALW